MRYATGFCGDSKMHEPHVYNDVQNAASGAGWTHCAGLPGRADTGADPGDRGFDTPAFVRWLARTAGATPMNADERLGYTKELASEGCSFSGDEMMWVITTLEQRLDNARTVMREVQEEAMKMVNDPSPHFQLHRVDRDDLE